MKKINLKNIMILYIILQPIIDIITSILVRSINPKLTVGVFIRAIFMVFIAIYAIIKSNKKDRIKLLIYYACLGLYMLMFLFICYKANGTTMILSQIKGLIKTFYFPIVLVALFAICKEQDLKIPSKIFICTLFLYVVTILFAKITGIAYNTYTYENAGTIGLFYAANEIGAVICLLAPIAVITFMKRKIDLFDIVTYILYIFASLEIGTKVVFLGLILLLSVLVFMSLVNIIIKKERKYIKNLIITFVTIIVIVFSLPFTAIGKNIEKNYGISFKNVFNISAEPPYEPQEKPEPDIPSDEITTALVSNRDLFLKNNMELYSKSKTPEKILGIGYIMEKDNELVEVKTCEMDYFDIFIFQGGLGTIIYFLPVLYIAFIILKDLIKKIKYKALLDNEIILLSYGLGLSAIIALLAGHTLVAPAVSFFIAIAIIELKYSVEQFTK